MAHTVMRYVFPEDVMDRGKRKGKFQSRLKEKLKEVAMECMKLYRRIPRGMKLESAQQGSSRNTV